MRRTLRRIVRGQTQLKWPHKRYSKSRREFLRSIALLAGVLSAALLAYLPLRVKARARLRPPGALAEQEFLAACIKCGQCVQVCPVHAIKLADLDEGFGLGVPYIEPRTQSCDFSCDALQCVLACPTGALSHTLNYPREVRIGQAQLVHPDLCLAHHGRGLEGSARGPTFNGLLRYAEIDRWNPLLVRDHRYHLELCDLCIRQCPIEIQITQCAAGQPPSNDPQQCPPRHAISLEAVTQADGVSGRIPVVHEGCVGCGVCEMVCPTEPAAIVINQCKVERRA